MNSRRLRHMAEHDKTNFYHTKQHLQQMLQEHTRMSKVPGPRLNIKTVLSTYGDFHVKDKTAVRTSYL